MEWQIKMISLGLKSKFFGTLPTPLFQVVAVRGYAEHKGDEDIKWQWSVRESPCLECYKYKDKRGWLSKILKRKKEEELTNRHREVKYQPKIWELEYYNYLLPECNPKEKKTKRKSKKPSAKSPYPVCGYKNFSCEGRQELVSLERGDELKPCTVKLNIPHKEPFCLNETCGKIKPLKKDNCDDESEFLCLNHLIENKQKNEDDSDEKCCKTK
ncbi:uncharacterized protein LOC124367496 [Homalodisca vitripennis]|uniref:uncharacterized protein LOC124367496 n=1 Tax=Homalodisca vitripennis TaxID=197043 RepID=UPI001EECE42E|nr:uncharacterized protein LOC124367496 [Homalodisca vitripennis]